MFKNSHTKKNLVNGSYFSHYTWNSFFFKFKHEFWAFHTILICNFLFLKPVRFNLKHMAQCLINVFLNSNFCSCSTCLFQFSDIMPSFAQIHICFSSNSKLSYTILPSKVPSRKCSTNWLRVTKPSLPGIGFTSASSCPKMFWIQ